MLWQVDFVYVLRAEQDVQEKIARKIGKDLRKNKFGHDFHRCTHCGHYGKESIQRFLDMYDVRIKSLKRNRIMWLIVTIVFSPFLLVPLTLLRKDFFEYGWEGKLLTFSIFFLLALIFLYKTVSSWKMPTRDEIKNNTNSPEIVSKWLGKWNSKKTQDRLEKMLTSITVEERNEHWVSLFNSLHYLIPY